MDIPRDESIEENEEVMEDDDNENDTDEEMEEFDDDDENDTFVNPLDRGNEYLERLIDPEKRLYSHKNDPLWIWLREKNWDELSKHVNTFENWELLPTEIKFKIIRETDFMTRFSLMFTSKSNYKIARSVPMSIKSIKIQEDKYHLHDEDEKEENAIRVELNSELRKSYSADVTVFFVKIGEDTKVTRTLKRGNSKRCEKDILFKNCDYLEVSESFVKKLLALTDRRLDHFEVRADDWGGDMSFLNSIQVGEDVTLWSFNGSSPLRKFQFDHETFQNTKSFSIRSDMTFSDDYILSLNCEEIHTRGVQISDNAINMLVKRWINGGGPREFSSFETRIRKMSDNDDVILEGIEAFEWDEQFKLENAVLSNWLEWTFSNTTYYYIENKDGSNGATLGIGSDSVSFYITGKRWKLDIYDPLVLMWLLQQ